MLIGRRSPRWSFSSVLRKHFEKQPRRKLDRGRGSETLMPMVLLLASLMLTLGFLKAPLEKQRPSTPLLLMKRWTHRRCLGPARSHQQPKRVSCVDRTSASKPRYLMPQCLALYYLAWG